MFLRFLRFSGHFGVRLEVLKLGGSKVCCLHTRPPAMDLLACGACWVMEIRPRNSMIHISDLAWTLDPYTLIIGR